VVSDETNHLVVVSFRGSADISNWITNAQILFDDLGMCNNCQVHLGFWNAWTSVRDKVWSALIAINLTYKIIVTGHSLGGAIATLAAADLRDMGYDVALVSLGAFRCCVIASDIAPTLLTKLENSSTPTELPWWEIESLPYIYPINLAAIIVLHILTTLFRDCRLEYLISRKSPRNTGLLQEIMFL